MKPRPYWVWHIYYICTHMVCILMCIYIYTYIYIYIYIYTHVYIYIYTQKCMIMYIFIYIYICMWCLIPCIVGSIGTVCSIGPSLLSLRFHLQQWKQLQLVGIMGWNSHWLSEFDFSFHEKVIGFSPCRNPSIPTLELLRTRDLQVGLSFSWNSLTEKRIYICHVQYDDRN